MANSENSDANLNSTKPGDLPEPLAKYLRDSDEDQAVVVVNAADGWRHGSPGVDLTDDKVRKSDRKLAIDSVARIGKDDLSEGESFLAERARTLDDLQIP